MGAQLEDNKVLMSSNPSKNIEMQAQYQNELNFNNLPEIKNKTYLTNLNEFKSIGTHWIALGVNGNNVIFW